MKGVVRTGGPAAVLLALAITAPVAALGLFHVWSRTSVQAAGYELGRLESEHRQLLSERDRLNLEVATLRSPGRLERFARERLGMAPPAPGAVVAGMAGGKAWVGGVGDGADQRPGPAEPDVKNPSEHRKGRGGPLTRAPEPARP
ncbi:MAG: cell division protein FtsL [Deltaproteobacteria bacterium]